MEKIPFKTNDNKYGPPITSYVPSSKQEGDLIINKYPDRQELQVEIRIRSGEDISPTAYLFPNGMVLLQRQYSYVFYKTRKDLENALELDKIMQRKIKELEQDPYFKNTFVKHPSEGDPKSRAFLLKDSTSVLYSEYSQSTHKNLLDTFQEVSREKVKWGVLIQDGSGRTIFYRGIHKTEEIEEGVVQQCLFFDSKEDYQLYINYMSLANPRLWQGRNPTGSDLLSNQEELLKILASMLELKREDLVYTKSAENKVHRALWNLIYTDEVANTLFLPLLMYLGELQINTYGGEWRFREIQEIEAVVPCIYFQGVEFDIARNMFHKILDPDNKSLQPLAACLWNGKNENWMYR